MTQPEFSLYGLDGDWLIENQGVDPDIVVDNRPDLVMKGQDPQLEKAVELVTKEIQATRRNFRDGPRSAVSACQTGRAEEVGRTRRGRAQNNWQMKQRRNRIRSLVTLILLVPVAAPAGEPDVNVIIRRSVEANQADWKAAPEYSYYEREHGENGGTKTYAVLMIMASPYRRQVLANGKPLPFEEEQKEQQKLEEAIARRCRESAHDRQERIAQYEKDRKRDELLMEQLTNAFDFKLLGQQKKGSCDTYVLEAMPRPGYQPVNTETEVLTGMQGKLWIDKKSFQWVRVEAQVVRPVTIEGFLARVEPGTRFELEKMPVEDRVWLPKRFSVQSRARILFLFTYGTQEEETYFNYRKVRPLQTGAGLEEQVAAARHFLTTDLP